MSANMALSVHVTLAFTFLLTLAVIEEAKGVHRSRRSPHKKHRIVFGAEGQVEGDGWSAPPPPPPIAPPEPAQTTVVDHQTVVEHHHHHHYDNVPPPSRGQGSGSVYIEFNKAAEEEKIRKFQAEMNARYEQMQREKQENLEKLRKVAEEKMEKLAKIPQQIATDIDYMGQRIKEDIDSKRNNNEGVTIQIWKNKGGHVSHGGSGGVSGSTEVHHHHYHDQEPPKPPPVVHRPPPPPPPPPQTSYEDYSGHDYAQKFGDMHKQFFTFLEAAGSQYRVPVSEEGSSSGSVESGGGGGGGLGKGFSLNVWKNKGRRRR